MNKTSLYLNSVCRALLLLFVVLGTSFVLSNTAFAFDEGFASSSFILRDVRDPDNCWYSLDNINHTTDYSDTYCTVAGFTDELVMVQVNRFFGQYWISSNSLFAKAMFSHVAESGEPASFMVTPNGMGMPYFNSDYEPFIDTYATSSGGIYAFFWYRPSTGKINSQVVIRKYNLATNTYDAHTAVSNLHIDSVFPFLSSVGSIVLSVNFSMYDQSLSNAVDTVSAGFAMCTTLTGNCTGTVDNSSFATSTFFARSANLQSGFSLLGTPSVNGRYSLMLYGGHTGGATSTFTPLSYSNQILFTIDIDHIPDLGARAFYSATAFDNPDLITQSINIIPVVSTTTGAVGAAFYKESTFWSHCGLKWGIGLSWPQFNAFDCIGFLILGDKFVYGNLFDQFLYGGGVFTTGAVNTFPFNLFYEVYGALSTSSAFTIPVIGGTIPNVLPHGGTSSSFELSLSSSTVAWFWNSTTSAFTASSTMSGTGAGGVVGTTGATYEDIINYYADRILGLLFIIYVIIRFIPMLSGTATSQYGKGRFSKNKNTVIVKK